MNDIRSSVYAQKVELLLRLHHVNVIIVGSGCQCGHRAENEDGGVHP
jgi:hypothetical protein